MRCTKCSFISFDDLSACAKCSNDLSHLSKELNGTCIETRQEFFLGSAIQTPGPEEDILSDSQPLPPIDHSLVNFDDTNTGNFSPLLSPSSDASVSGFDDSIGFSSEDDVDIELGDIMPLDLDQLDSGGSSSGSVMENTDLLSSGDMSFDLDQTNNLSDSGSDFKFDDDLSEVDISVSAFSANDSSDAGVLRTSAFDTTLTELPADRFKEAGFELDEDLLSQLSDADGNLDETVSLGVGAGLNETQITRLTSGVGEFVPLELDESLVAELAGGPSPDASGEFSVGFSSDESGSGEFELDAALVAELASEENAVVPGGGGQPIMNEVGDLPPLREADDIELSGLDLADIDVSDLVDTSLGVGAHDQEDIASSDAASAAFSSGGMSQEHVGVGVMSLPADDVLSDDDIPSSGLSLGQVAEGEDLEIGVDTLVFDDDFEAYLEGKNGSENLPTIELVSDEDDVPPDLPA